MTRILRSHLANEDLIAEHNPTAASKLLRKFDRAFALLATNPSLGEQQSKFGPDLRRFTLGAYLSFYQPLTDGIRVVRVLHGARRYDELL